MKYKVGNKVRIKSIDWYNYNKDEYGDIDCGAYTFTCGMTKFCGKIVTIHHCYNHGCYTIKEDDNDYTFTSEMIEGLVGTNNECQIILPEGYQFIDEDGNIINTTTIILEKKKKGYPTTYEECCEILGIGSYFEPEIRNVTSEECHKFTKLIRLKRCRDAYWKIAGEEMGLGKPWEPTTETVYCISRNDNIIKCSYRGGKSNILEFPTAEIRDVFKDNFDPDIAICKEFL